MTDSEMKLARRAIFTRVPFALVALSVCVGSGLRGAGRRE